MIRSIQLFMALAVICCILLTVSPLLAQEWSKEQLEVWKNVQTYWDLMAKRDVEGFLRYFHDDYSGWDYGEALPGDKASAQKWLSFYFPKSEVLLHEIKPVAIQIHGNVAIVHYCYAEATKDLEGKTKFSQGRWTDILMKQGDKWVMIGDHGGETSKE